MYFLFAAALVALTARTTTDTSEAVVVLGALLSPPAILGLVEAGKKAGMPVRFAPIAAVLIGVAAGLAVQASEIGTQDWILGVAAGYLAGLGASGLYSGAPTVAGKAGPGPEPPPVP